MNRADRRAFIFKAIAIVCAIPAAFFTFYGVLLIYTVITFEGEGSLGHVGLHIAAILYPMLAILFVGCTVLAWRNAKKPAGSVDRAESE